MVMRTDQEIARDMIQKLWNSTRVLAAETIRGALAFSRRGRREFPSDELIAGQVDRECDKLFNRWKSAATDGTTDFEGIAVFYQSVLRRANELIDMD